MGMFSKIKEHIYSFNEKIWMNRIRKNNKNKNFTLITNNCIGGVIYHNLGMEFTSPTINLFIRTDEYVNFCRNLSVYTHCEMIEDTESDMAYPVGILIPENGEYPPVHVHFQHYPDFKTAKEKWITRCQRIHYENIYFLMEYYGSIYDSKYAVEFDNLPLKTMVLLHNPMNQIKDAFVLHCYKDDKPLARVIEKRGISGKRYLDEFDYVKFLNS